MKSFVQKCLYFAWLSSMLELSKVLPEMERNDNIYFGLSFEKYIYIHNVIN